jgi:SM-20-related protein
LKVGLKELVDRYGLFLTANFLDDAICLNIIAAMHSSEAKAATIHGYRDSAYVYDRIRKATRLELPPAITESVSKRLLEHKGTIAQHFSISLHDCENPQFLRYEVGDFFVAHQDGNTGLLRLTSDAKRKVSIVIFLNGQSEQADSGTYSGGSLKFSDYSAAPPYDEFELPVSPGMLVAFRSELTHEVTPVTRGQRYSIVSWYR